MRNYDAIRMLTDPLGWLKDNLMNWGLENFCRRYYAAYPGIVIQNDDPTKRGFIRATCPAIKLIDADDVPDDFWIPPNWPGMGNSDNGQMTGMFWPPEVGSQVWITFRMGDPRYPVYTGGSVTADKKSDTFDSDKAYKRGFRTKAGHFIRFDDDPDNLSVMIVRGDGSGEPTPVFISLDKDGSVQVSNKNGSQVFMDAKNNETTVLNADGSNVTSTFKLGDDAILLQTKSGGMISIDKKDVSITGDNVMANCNKQFYANAGTCKIGANAAEPAVRGNKLMLWGALHPHPTSAPGAPTGPTPLPIVLGNELSDKVYIS